MTEPGARRSQVGLVKLANLPYAVLAGSMSWGHRDPFDRLLVAQALVENAGIVTVDRWILKFPGVRTLTWST